jgi:DNA-binding LacI/PurR family transcriptional regulator
VLCVASELIRRGVRIPQDASVMCRDSDHFLHYFSPQIARYSADPRMHAQRLAKLVLRVARQGAGLLPQVRFLPRFSPGESLGPVS